jgi:N-acetylglucosaminyldiphosphoundecaprenol N-acetyl-beta-D-mannosaminyltransferase
VTSADVAPFSDLALWTGSLDEAVQRIAETVENGRPATFRLINANSVHAASRDDAYADVLRGGGVNLIDGRPLAKFMAWRTGRAVEQVRGPELFLSALDRHRHLRHFLLGGSPELLDELSSALRRRYPGLTIAGSYSPPFRPFSDEDRNDYLDAVTAARADIVWVGLGTPKQDIEAAVVTERAGVTSVAVGAAFDFAAGTKAECPAFLRAAGLEWLFRFLSEPRRLWRRYLFGNSHFIGQVFREVFTAGRLRPRTAER